MNPTVGLEDPGIRHVQEAIFDNECPLRTEKALETDSYLWGKLQVAGKLISVLVHGGVNYARAPIEQRFGVSARAPFQANNMV